MHLERNFIERSHVLSTLVFPMKTSPKPTAHGHNQDLDIHADEIQNISITKIIHISPFYSHNDFPHIHLHLLLSPTLSLIRAATDLTSISIIFSFQGSSMEGIIPVGLIFLLKHNSLQIHPSGCVYQHCVAFYFHVWMYHSLYNHLPIKGQWSCFPFLAITKNL